MTATKLPRAIAKTALTVGLLHIPVTIHGLTEDKAPTGRLVRASDGSPVRQPRIAEADGERVDYADCARLMTATDGTKVVVTTDDLAVATGDKSRLVEILRVVDRSEVPTHAVKAHYLLAPQKGAGKAYRLFWEALEVSGRVALVTVALRTRVSPAVIVATPRGLMLHTLWWADEQRPASVLADVDVSAEEVGLAVQLLDQLAAPAELGGWVDESRGAVQAMVDAKAAGVNIQTGEVAEPVVSRADDLLASLRAAVEATKEARAAAGLGVAS